MGKLKHAGFLTLIYSLIMAGLICLIVYLISTNVIFNIKETVFLIGLVLVLVGIVFLIARHQSRVVSFEVTEAIRQLSGEEDKKGSFLLTGFNGFTILLTGVFILLIDAFIT